jgi:hypothetical protein
VRLRLLQSLVISLALGAACDDDGSTPHAGGADRLPPDPVLDLALAYHGATEEVEFTWTAPRDDLARDRVDRYEIRVAYAEPFAWDRSTATPSSPDPLAAGSPQLYTFAGVTRGRDLYAAVRAYDLAGNESPLSNLAHVRVPGVTFEATCVEAVSKAPVPGLAVQVTTLSSQQLATDGAGRVSLSDVAEGTMGIRIERGNAADAYHSLTDAFVIDDDRSVAYPMIAYARPVSPLYDSVLRILLDALVRAGSGNTVKRWANYPIAWYAGDFVNSSGLDYRAIAERAASRWNERTGMEIFVTAAAVPAVGVTVQFLPRSVMGIQNGITEHSNDAGGYPKLDRIKVVDDFSDEQVLYTIMMHEFGHAIRLSHLPGGFIMYGGQPLPADITDDEVQTVRLLVSLPNDLDLDLYDPAPPQ